LTPSERSLRIVLFTDIVASTERAAELGDHAWRQTLAEFHAIARREIRRFAGREANAAGDGFLAVFDRPARAIRCAWAVREEARELGLEVRSGIHAGEVEGSGAHLAGIGVHIGSRVASEAGAGEVLVSSTVRELVTGAGFRFEDRGKRALKGVPQEWRLFALQGLPAGISRRTGRWVPELTGRHVALGGGAVLAAVILALVLRGALDSDGLVPEAGATGAAPAIAVLPFSVHGQHLDVWREGMVDLLSTGLDGAGGLRAIDSRTVLARWKQEVGADTEVDLSRAILVARRTGARYALVGSAVAVGPEVRLVADVYEIRSGRSMGQVQVEGAADSVLALVDRLAVQALGVVLRKGPGELPAIDLAAVTTASLPALKAYLEGETLFRRSEFEAAIAAFERAVSADSTFALAFYRLSQSYGWVENIESERAREALDRAARFTDRLPEREAIVVRGEISMFTGTLDQMESMRAAVRKYPDDVDAWYVLGELYFHLGQQALIPMEESDRAFSRAAALDPAFAPTYIHLIENAFTRADSGQAAALVETHGRLAPGSLQDRLNRFAFDLAFGDPAARTSALASMDSLDFLPRRSRSIGRMLFHPRFLALQERVLRAARARHDATASVPINLFLNHYFRGQLRTALADLNDPLMPAEFRPAALYRLSQAGMSIPIERLAPDLGANQGAGFGPFYLGAHAVDRDGPADLAKAVRLLDAQAERARVDGDSVLARSSMAAARALDGYARWRHGRGVEGLEILEAAQREALGIGPAEEVNATIRWWLGILLLELDRPRDAERYFRSFWYDPLARLPLAQVHQALGEEERVRAAQDYFEAAWSDADPGVLSTFLEARGSSSAAGRSGNGAQTGDGGKRDRG
jgi:class 3 adenylate cyclase/tetratricopeptide (TPR) repeat protein